MRSGALLVSIVAAAAFTVGCVGAEKSANPLSPTVAGPLPGVAISAPSPLQPVGSRIAVDQQPVTLMVDNAGTNGVRPLHYLFEVATDAGFTNKVFTRDGITPSDGGHTSLRLPDPLATSRTYYWHAKALDGANESSYSYTANFDVYTPIVIQAPVLVSPIGNVTTTTTRPRFTLNDAGRSGPVGTISYTIEVADSDSFANKIAVWVVAETPGQTSIDTPGGDLPANKQIFWHARASDPTTSGPFSSTAVFTTPAPVVAPPPAGGGGAGDGSSNGAGSAADQINLASAFVYNSPSDVANWPVTTNINRVVLQPSGSPTAGVALTFSAQGVWPDVTPPGWPSGGIQYTVWAVVNVAGHWYTSGFIEMWTGRPSTGAPILSDFARNWAYDARWGPMQGHQPQPGEQMGFFVTAGDARGYSTATSYRERSNVVIVTLPAGDSGVFTY